jgi:hypothetical protein
MFWGKICTNYIQMTYRVRSWIQPKAMIVIPYDRLNSKRQWTKMTLMGDSCYQLRRKGLFKVFKGIILTINKKDISHLTHMLKRVTCFFRCWRNETWPPHPVKEILPEKHNFLCIKLHPELEMEHIGTEKYVTWSVLLIITSWSRLVKQFGQDVLWQIYHFSG